MKWAAAWIVVGGRKDWRRIGFRIGWFWEVYWRSVNLGLGSGKGRLKLSDFSWFLGFFNTFKGVRLMLDVEILRRGRVGGRGLGVEQGG